MNKLNQDKIMAVALSVNLETAVTNRLYRYQPINCPRLSKFCVKKKQTRMTGHPFVKVLKHSCSPVSAHGTDIVVNI